VAERVTGSLWLPLTVVPAVAAFAVAVVALPRWGEPPTSYAAVSGPARVADLVAGLGLLLAGLVGLLDASTRRLGLLAMLAGAIWFAPDWEGWEHGPPLVRSIGAALPPLLLVLALHLVSAAPRGHVGTRRLRVLLTAAYVLAGTVIVGRALVRDPLFDPNSWRNRLDNVFLVHTDRGLTEALDGLWLRAAIVIGVLAVFIAGQRLLVATGPGRRALVPIVAPAALLAIAEGAYAAQLLRRPHEDPTAAEFASLFYARAAAVMLLAAGLLLAVARARRLRASVGRLTSELGDAPQPGTLQTALAAAVGDPTLEVAYPLGGASRYVGADGRLVTTPVAGNGRAVTPITRDGRQLAVVVHDAALVEGRGLEREIGSAARLSVENERLRAEVLAQLEELRASRARIVDRGDAERRHLERDLHDGAQQRLLALSFDVRLARGAAREAGETEAARLLGAAEDAAHEALGELRKLAHGLFPAVLAEAGLGAALATLADEAPLPVELGDIVAVRYEDAIESAAYVTVVEAVEDAVARQATFVGVDVEGGPERLTIVVRDDGAPRAAPLVHLVDRVGALGGSVDATPMSLRVEIPCG